MNAKVRGQKSGSRERTTRRPAIQRKAVANKRAGRPRKKRLVS